MERRVNGERECMVSQFISKLNHKFSDNFWKYVVFSSSGNISSVSYVIPLILIEMYIIDVIGCFS